MTSLSAHMSASVFNANEALRDLLSSFRGISSRLRRHAVLAGTFALTLLMGAMSVAVHAQNVTFEAQTTVPASGLSYPFGVAVDRTGDVFIGDSNNNRVLKVTPGGIQTTVPATGLNYPQGVAVDGAGDVFIADSNNHRVVEVTPEGVQSTVGSGLGYDTDVAVDGAGDVFIADTGHNRVVEVPAGGGSQVLVASGVNALGVAVDGAGDVFIAGSGKVVEVPAGGGSQLKVGSGFSIPIGVAVDGAGDVFIADFGTSLVWEVPAGGGAQFTVGSGFANPVELAVDGAGDLFIADQGNRQIEEVQPSQGNFGNVNVCPTGQTIPAPCSQTLILHYSSAAETTFGATSVVTQGAPNLDFQSAGSTCTGPVSAGSTCAVSVRFAPLAPGMRMGAVQLLDTSGNLIASALLQGIGQGPAVAFGTGIQIPFGSGWGNLDGAAVDALGDVFIVDSSYQHVVKVTPGGVQTVVVSGVSANGIAVDGAGDLFISVDPVVMEVTPGGVQTALSVSGLSDPVGVAVDGAGDVYAVDYNDPEVFEITPSGVQTTITLNGVDNPTGLAVDAAGDVFVADPNNNQVVKVTPGGVQTTVPAVGLSGFASYSGSLENQFVAVDAAGDVFIADNGNARVVEVSPSGVQTTVASGIEYQAGLAVDSAGNVFIADSYSSVVELPRSQAPSLSFLTATVGSASIDSPHSFTIQNIGNQPLDAVGPGVAVYGSDFIQAAGPGTPEDCTGSFALTPGAICNLSISFVPQNVGPDTGEAVFTDNALNAPSASQTISLAGTGTLSTQSITWVINAPASAAYLSSFTVAASASSTLAVTYTSAGACANSGSTYTMTSSAGACSVIVTQPGTSTYPAVQATENVTAIPAAQSITVTTNAPASAVYNSTFTVTAGADATSGIAVSFSSSGACTNGGITLSGGSGPGGHGGPGGGKGGATATVTYTMTSGTGTCSVILSAAGNSNYAPAQITQSVTAIPVPLTITANNKTMTLDAALPAFDAAYSGFIGSDGPGALSGSLTCSTTTNGKSIGTFPINCSGLTSANYSIAYIGGTLTVQYATAGACDGSVGHQILQPINADGTSVFNSKSTTPAQFRVCDANGASIGTAGVVKSFVLYQIVSGTVDTAVNELVDSTTPDAAFRWDSTNQQWIFNISNKGIGPANQTYFFLITLNDGSTINFNYGLK